ncbi:MAG TPA: hypothetical protein VMU66_03510 [Gaiellales bacterium]|nr:hypothetical protein [Gaiellales bacterium]
MRVRSPIGDLPFTVRSIRRDGSGLVVEGDLGAWTSEIRISACDLAPLARALRRPLLAGAAAAAAVAVWRMRR